MILSFLFCIEEGLLFWKFWQWQKFWIKENSRRQYKIFFSPGFFAQFGDLFKIILNSCVLLWSFCRGCSKICYLGTVQLFLILKILEEFFRWYFTTAFRFLDFGNNPLSAQYVSVDKWSYLVDLAEKYAASKYCNVYALKEDDCNLIRVSENGLNLQNAHER